MTYQARLARALQSLRLAPGAVSTARIQHDPDCPGAKGCPVCRCVPTITIKTPTGSVRVMPDGTTQPTENLN